MAGRCDLGAAENHADSGTRLGSEAAERHVRHTGCGGAGFTGTVITQTLSRSEARGFYDRFGARQDRQGFYEDAALARLVERGNFSQAQRVLELGCGTGRFAARLLDHNLPATAHYVAIDLSSTMTRLAAQRLARFGKRCEVHTSSGEFEFADYGGHFDRIVSTYVLDLLSLDDIGRCLAAAHAVLADGGLFCHAGLTVGTGPLSRTTSALWSLLHRIKPALVGGCRPLRLTDHISAQHWQVVHRSVVISATIPSEVIIARAR